ncbi:LamB/YcsF family protein [Propionicimonas sp.]|uniref:LamB/YcsF family protein n=1 Tax=Propionicimonas sp. TaxID=1955623 RepID=UPI0039E3E3A9
MEIDLTAEVGHGLAESATEADNALWPLISTALVPCGIHAGDPTSILRACSEAVTREVALGAAVGYADRIGGGERFVDYDPDDLAATIIYQLGALDGLALAEQARVTCVRPSGALFEAARTDRNHAWALVNAVLDYDPTLTIVGLPDSRLLQTAERNGISVAREFQPHRLLNANGSLGAVVTDPEAVARRAVEAVSSGGYTCVRLPWHTAAERACAKGVRAALVEAGHVVAAPSATAQPEVPVHLAVAARG